MGAVDHSVENPGENTELATPFSPFYLHLFLRPAIGLSPSPMSLVLAFIPFPKFRFFSPTELRNNQTFVVIINEILLSGWKLCFNSAMSFRSLLVGSTAGHRFSDQSVQ